jgi:quercetin dioxygenase-like cupin family protein
MSESGQDGGSDGGGGGRSRELPEVRFASPQHEIDLGGVARELAAAPARHGRRQRALYHHGRLTVSPFTFEPGAGLPDHVAAGVVTIQVLDGRLRVKCGTVEQVLPAGKLLVLAPGVRHDVLAEAQSNMLLQVYLEDAADKQQ